MRLIILDNDQAQLMRIKIWFSERNYVYDHFTCETNFINKLASGCDYDCIILDWSFCDANGINILDNIRKIYNIKIPIIILSKIYYENDVINALEYGADRFITKPLRRNEFLARINSVCRSTSYRSKKLFHSNKTEPYDIDKFSQAILINNQPIALTQKEYELAAFLFRKIGHVISRDYILTSVWGKFENIMSRTVDTHISRVRTKLKLDGKYGWYLNSIYGHGYQLDKRKTHPSNPVIND